VGLDGELSALPAATRAPAPDREPPAAELVCSDCRLSRIKPTAADVIDGELRIRPRWELRHPPEFYSTSGGERETGDNLELLPGGLQVVSGDQSAGILRGRKLVNRTHSYGFPWGGSRMIWFQRPDGGFRLFDDDGSYVTLDENMRRTDPLLPHEQLALPTQRLHSLSSREKFALFGWLLAALPVGIALLWKHGKLKRKKLAIALLAAYAFSLYVSIDLLRDHVRLMREQAAVIG
jgi:hypothetical protein